MITEINNNLGNTDNQLTRIEEMTSDFRLINGLDKVLYAEFENNNKLEIWPLLSESIHNLIFSRLIVKYKKIPDKSIIDKFLGLLSHRAKEQKYEPVCLRSARIENKVYINLNNLDGEFVEIDTDGWQIVRKVPVNFIKNKHMYPVQLPKRNGDIFLIKKYLNIQGDEDLIIVLSFCISVLFGLNAYPILLVQGPQGSAKSTFTKFLKMLVDPAHPLLRTLPSEDETMLIAGISNALLCFDNLSGVTDKMSDILCRVSTGGSLTKRKLYTNLDEEVVEICRPVVLNSIDDIVERPDLADRSITLKLQKISDENRSSSEQLQKEFEEMIPYFWGCLLDGISYGLREVNQVKLKTATRMYDFCKISCACLPAFGFSQSQVLETLIENRNNLSVEMVHSIDLGGLIVELMSHEENWVGTISELGTRLSVLKPENERIPILKSKSALSKELNRIAPVLSRVDIEVQKLPRTKDRRPIRIYKINRPSSSLSPAQPTQTEFVN